MTVTQDWRSIIASSLDWEQAHSKLESVVNGLAPSLQGVRPTGYPHSAWELLEHIRITQNDLLEFCQNPEYEEKLAWPQDYWPPTPAPPTADAWEKTISDYRRDREALAALLGNATPTTPPGGTTTPPSGTVAQLIASAKTHYDQAQKDLKNGDFTGYAQEIQTVGQILQQLAALQPSAAASASPKASP